MTDINILFCRELLSKAHALVKQKFPNVNLRKDAWVWSDGRQHWEFHGPGEFYWYGSADNAYGARYHGWMAWLESKGIDDVVIKDDDR
jgi:hypothetical protein